LGLRQMYVTFTFIVFFSRRTSCPPPPLFLFPL
jgi:hypothetical protein